ncbi:MAG: hypothetical protein ACAH88_01555, partial [Roseimicrobium sp.]
MASPDYSDLSAATLHLYRITGVVGLLLMKSGNQLANHMPFADVRTTELGEHVTRMAGGYSHVKRRVRQVLMLFDSGTLLIVMKDQIQLALMLTPQADLDKASLSAGAFLADYAAQLEAAAPTVQVAEVAPVAQATQVVQEAKVKVVNDDAVAVIPVAISFDEPIKEKALPVEDSVWPKVSSILETILGKVMGNAQATRLISRMCVEKHGVTAPRIDPPEAKAL